MVIFIFSSILLISIIALFIIEEKERRLEQERIQRLEEQFLKRLHEKHKLKNPAK